MLDFLLDITAGGVEAGAPQLNIQAKHGPMLVNPAPIQFSAVNQQGFTLPEETEAGVWKPVLHRLLYIWDFGAAEAGTFSAPVNLVPEHNDTRYAYGPRVFHVFETPGVKTVTLRVYDLDSDGATPVATQSWSGEVLSQYTAFPGGAKYVVAQDDGQWSGAPAGATLVANADAAVAALKASGAPGVILLPRGQITEHNFTERNIDNSYPSFMIDAYGTGAKPRLAGGIKTASSFGDDDCLVIANIELSGTWDNITQTDAQGGITALDGFGANHDGIYALINIDAEGIRSFVGSSANNDKATTCMVWNCVAHNWRNAGGTFSAAGDHLFFGIRGSRFSQPSEGLGRTIFDNGASEQWGLRLKGHASYYFESCDFFSNSGNSSRSIVPPVMQPTFRMSKGHPNNFVSMQRCTVEGKLQMSTTSGADELQAGNMIFDKVLILGSCQASNHLLLQHPGVTCRNLVFTMPDVSNVQSGWKAFITFGGGYSPIPPIGVQRTRTDTNSPYYDVNFDPSLPGYDPSTAWDDTLPTYDARFDPNSADFDARIDPTSGSYDPRRDPEAPDYNQSKFYNVLSYGTEPHEIYGCGFFSRLTAAKHVRTGGNNEGNYVGDVETVKSEPSKNIYAANNATYVPFLTSPLDDVSGGNPANITWIEPFAGRLSALRDLLDYPSGPVTETSDWAYDFASDPGDNAYALPGTGSQAAGSADTGELSPPDDFFCRWRGAGARDRGPFLIT